MLIISDCLTEKPDEGCLKVANTIVKKIKEKYDRVTVISYGNRDGKGDIHLKLNKWMFNKALFSIIHNTEEKVIYIPFASNTVGSILRTYFLSKMAKGQLSVVFVLLHPMNKLEKYLIRASKAEIIVLSKSAYQYYREFVGNHVTYIKTGIDIEKFHPVTESERLRLRNKYGIDQEKRMVLHVGHLKEGRNISQLMKLDESFEIILIISSETQDEQDFTLRERLKKKTNITIIEDYLPAIEEWYQMADVYFFPVQEEENCIDIPLSVLEAAACNVPVVATPFGELKELADRDGFYEIRSFESEKLNVLVQRAANERKNIRNTIMEYDWNESVSRLLEFWLKDSL